MIVKDELDRITSKINKKLQNNVITLDEAYNEVIKALVELGMPIPIIGDYGWQNPDGTVTPLDFNESITTIDFEG